MNRSIPLIRDFAAQVALFHDAVAQTDTRTASAIDSRSNCFSQDCPIERVSILREVHGTPRHNN
jgi:hypothetical protein